VTRIQFAQQIALALVGRSGHTGDEEKIGSFPLNIEDMSERWWADVVDVVDCAPDFLFPDDDAWQRDYGDYLKDRARAAEIRAAQRAAAQKPEAS
jgi:hypothetical protein